MQKLCGFLCVSVSERIYIFLDLPNDERLRNLWISQDLWTVAELQTIIKSWQDNTEQQLKSSEQATQLLNKFLQLVFAFVQNNFTGPFDKLEACQDLLISLKLEPSIAQEQLKASGEELNPNVKTPQLLLVAQQMLDALIAAQPTSKLLSWWRLRLVCLHQHMLDDLASALYEQFKLSVADLRPHLAAFGEEDKELQSLLLLEIANGYLQFHRSDLSCQTLTELCDQLQVELQVEGLLGVRTKFQQKPLPQLCLKVVQQSGSDNGLPTAMLSNKETTLPQLLLLEDDTRLERIRFIEPKDNEVMTLPSVLQALVLAKVKQLKRSQPKDRLADEQLEPYTQTLLYQQHGPLQVRQAALLLNSHQESGMRRTVERSWKQCEECVKLLDNTEQHTLRERLSYGFAAFMLPKWQVQLQLVDLLRSLGMTKTALDICLQIHAWQQVIECYTSLELRHKAAEIIRQELEKQPTVLLYCLLGDAVDDPQCYEQAWLHSKQTSGKAQAYWGNYFYRRADYAQAITHYEISLEINSLQESILLRGGYSAIQLERWDLAVKCYLAYTHLEPHGFESWNNLAKALIKLGDKQRAHRLLGEALKCNYSNWKVWENYMLVSVDIAHWEDAMRAYQRLGELKQHYLDEELLTRIVYGIARQMQSDCAASSQAMSSSLHRRITQLLGQQCVQHGNEPLVWELAALVAATPLKKAERLVKSYRAYTAKELNWETKSAHAKKALSLCLDVAELSLAALKEHAEDESEAMITSQLNSSRLAATSCLNALKRASLVEVPKEQLEQQQQLEQQLTELTGIVQQRMQRT
ncbi:tetratricopeptide repeat protein 27 isoform X2 [Drosophila grimshawi]|uniref:tetratricopeptide repeat protein 27 isoform X2 n=1 Tax=Drosophila grimshawi TaxID=7222 RepID=UPI000C870B77|nr:tetratricopeptide repeat protein 27 isoform X2 [Drosophila grimshawi]